MTAGVVRLKACALALEPGQADPRCGLVYTRGMILGSTLLVGDGICFFGMGPRLEFCRVCFRVTRWTLLVVLSVTLLIGFTVLGASGGSMVGFWLIFFLVSCLDSFLLAVTRLWLVGGALLAVGRGVFSLGVLGVGRDTLRVVPVPQGSERVGTCDLALDRTGGATVILVALVVSLSSDGGVDSNVTVVAPAPLILRGAVTLPNSKFGAAVVRFLRPCSEGSVGCGVLGEALGSLGRRGMSGGKLGR